MAFKPVNKGDTNYDSVIEHTLFTVMLGKAGMKFLQLYDTFQGKDTDYNGKNHSN